MRIRKSKPIEFEVDTNGCFNCISHAPHCNGYARIIINQVPKLIHRHIYEEMFGPIPEGLVIRHKCDNRVCINPEHLETGTHAENMHDMAERKRSRNSVGVNNPNVKLTEKQVTEIKKALISGAKVKTLAIKHNVTTALIYRIKFGRAWNSVKIEKEAN